MQEEQRLVERVPALERAQLKVPQAHHYALRERAPRQDQGHRKVALRLLRASGGFDRMVHSMRCNPPEAQALALNILIWCAGALRIHPTDGQCEQATCSLSFEWPCMQPAYMASVGSTLELCQALDRSFSADVAAAPALCCCCLEQPGWGCGA
eukprot:s20_g26.t1